MILSTTELMIPVSVTYYLISKLWVQLLNSKKVAKYLKQVQDPRQKIL